MPMLRAIVGPDGDDPICAALHRPLQEDVSTVDLKRVTVTVLKGWSARVRVCRATRRCYT
jgi:hypothetical protein